MKLKKAHSKIIKKKMAYYRSTETLRIEVKGGIGILKLLNKKKLY